MNIHSTATPTLSGAQKHGAGRLILGVVGGCVLVLAVALGAAWAYRGNDAPAATPPNAELDVSTSRPSIDPAASMDPTLYLVGSEEEAVIVRANFDEANLIRGMNGETPRAYSVMVVSAAVPLSEMIVAFPGTVFDLRTR